MVTIVTRAGKGSALTHAELDANQVNLNNGKAEVLDAVTETGAAWTLTRAAHAQRLVIATNAAAITVTFNTAGMTTSDFGRVVHGGAGQVTFTGATFAYAGGVSATPTIPAGVRNWVDWRFDGTNIVIDQKSEDATGGGGGAFLQDVRNFTAVDASGAAGVEQTNLRVLNMSAITSANKIIKISGMFDAGDETADSIAWKVYIGSVLVLQRNFGGHRSYSFDTAIAIRALSGVGSSVTIALDGSMDTINFNPAETLDIDVSGAWTVSVSCQKQTTSTRRATVQWLRATVE